MKNNEKGNYYNYLKEQFLKSGIKKGMILGRNEICKLLNIPLPKGNSTREKLSKEFSCLFKYDENYWNDKKKYKITRIYIEQEIRINFDKLLTSSQTGKHNNHNTAHNNDKFISIVIEMLKKTISNMNSMDVKYRCKYNIEEVSKYVYKLRVSSTKFFYIIGLLKVQSEDLYADKLIESSFSNRKINGAKFWECNKNKTYADIPNWNGIVNKDILTKFNLEYLYGRLTNCLIRMIAQLEKEKILVNYIKRLKFFKVDLDSGEFETDYIEDNILEEIEELKKKQKNVLKIHELICKKYEYSFLYTEYTFSIITNLLEDYQTNYSSYHPLELENFFLTNLKSAISTSIDKSKAKFKHLMFESDEDIDKIRISCNKVDKEYCSYLDNIFSKDIEDIF